LGSEGFVVFVVDAGSTETDESHGIEEKLEVGKGAFVGGLGVLVGGIDGEGEDVSAVTEGVGLTGGSGADEEEGSGSDDSGMTASRTLPQKLARNEEKDGVSCAEEADAGEAEEEDGSIGGGVASVLVSLGIEDEGGDRGEGGAEPGRGGGGGASLGLEASRVGL
jgi:hypothetical protein